MTRKHATSLATAERSLAGAAELHEVLFELSAIGNSVKVCAVDPHTGVEATIIGPLSAGEQPLKNAALQKLRYLLNKQAVATGASRTRFSA